MRIKRLLILIMITLTIICLIYLSKSLMAWGIIIPACKHDNHISLTVGQHIELFCTEKNVTWQSNNPFITVSDKGVVTVSKEVMYPESQAALTAYCIDTEKAVCKYNITIVPWIASKSSIEIMDAIPVYSLFGNKFYLPNTYLRSQFILPSKIILGYEDDKLYFSFNRNLYKSHDGLETKELITRLPFRPGKSRMLITPFGYFIRGRKGVYSSSDLISWNCILNTLHPPWLSDNMDFWYDLNNETGYLYVSEYSTNNPDARHHLYRGKVQEGEIKWSISYTLRSLNEQNKNPSEFMYSGRHFHIVKVDPYTGHVWAGTGDADRDAMMIRSTDNGKTFKIIGFGSQKYRTLAFWFTEKYIYWNMDTSAPPQMIFRICRSDLEKHGSLTPILTDGSTKPAVNYYVVDSEKEEYFPVPVGSKYTETIQRDLNEKNIVLALDDSNYIYKEVVANISNGSHWSVFPVNTDCGKNIILFSSTSEGFKRHAIRDNRGRIFGLYEHGCGYVEVQELYSISPHNQKFEMVRIEGAAQDKEGNIYFHPFQSIYGGSIIKGRLHWIQSYYNDNQQKD